MAKEEKRKLVITDPPSCDFLKTAMDDEEAAIHMYMDEAGRSNDEEIKTMFKYIAEQEMEHLRKLRTMYAKMTCAVKE